MVSNWITDFSEVFFLFHWRNVEAFGSVLWQACLCIYKHWWHVLVSVIPFVFPGWWMTGVWSSQRQVTLLILQRSSEVSNQGWFLFNDQLLLFYLLGHFYHVTSQRVCGHRDEVSNWNMNGRFWEWITKFARAQEAGGEYRGRGWIFL